MKPSHLTYLVFAIPLFFGAGCTRSIMTKNDSQISAGINTDDVITEYISANPLLAPTSSGGKVFVAYQDLGESQNGTTTTRYIWALIQEYYVDHGALQKGTGSSGPLAIHLTHQGNQDTVTGYDAPRDGNLYAKDIFQIFPLTVTAKIAAYKDSAPLQQREKKEASDFFLRDHTSSTTTQELCPTYQDMFLRDASPTWTGIAPDHYSLSIPYSSEWLVDGDLSLPEYQIDMPIQNQTMIRFGRPVSGGTYAVREYFIYRKPKMKLDLSSQDISVEPLKDELSCVDGFEARLTNIGDIEGIENHVGGAKGCSEGFAFNIGMHTYFLYHIPDMGSAPSHITDEMKKIIESVRE